MQAYAFGSVSSTPITYSYSSPNSRILHALTMEPHLIDWQLDPDHNSTITNPNVTDHFHHHHYHNHTQVHKYQECEDEDEARNKKEEEEEDRDDRKDHDFTFTCRAPVSSPVSADEIFFNGQIKPLKPFFINPTLKQDLHRVNNKKTVSVRLPLLKLMSQEDRDFRFASTSSSFSSCSSSEAGDEELEGIAPESYCIWRPRNARKDGSRSRRCNKSNSTGTMHMPSSSSKRWTLRDMLLNRSTSEDGKASNSKPSCIKQFYR